MLFAICFDLDQAKILSFGKVLIGETDGVQSDQTTLSMQSNFDLCHAGSP